MPQLGLVNTTRLKASLFKEINVLYFINSRRYFEKACTLTSTEDGGLAGKMLI